MGRVYTNKSIGTYLLIPEMWRFTFKYNSIFSWKVFGMYISFVTTSKSISLSSCGIPFAYEPKSKNKLWIQIAQAFF